MAETYDIAIAGGGLVGASLALALAGTGARVAVVEAEALAPKSGPGGDDRGLALSLSSREILLRLGLWAGIEASATPIRRLHVSEQGGFGRVILEASGFGLDALGYVVPAWFLQGELRRQLQAADVDFLCPARVRSAQLMDGNMRLAFSTQSPFPSLGCRLLVVADGPRSTLRGALGFEVHAQDYGQLAVVANVRPRRPHGGTAFERFSPSGPTALLPLADGRCVAVVCVAGAEPAAAGNHWQDDGEFLRLLAARFGARLGAFSEPGVRRSYPLQFLRVERQTGDRVVLLGACAHTFHPNGAQGFNLALRDVMGLVGTLRAAAAHNRDPGSVRVLQEYQRGRIADQDRTVTFSHGLARLFYNRNPALMAVRRLGLLSAALLPGVRRELVMLGSGLRSLDPGLFGEAGLA